MTTRVRGREILIVAACLAAGATVTACGSDGAVGSDATTAGTVTATAGDPGSTSGPGSAGTTGGSGTTAASGTIDGGTAASAVPVTLTGTVTAGTEPGCLLLDGYLLLGGPPDVLVPGQAVAVIGAPAPDAVTTCMEGIPFQVVSARTT